LSVIGQDAGIEHGTTKGYGQHQYRKVRATESCGCLQAVRDAKAAKTTARNGAKAGERGPRTGAQREWCGGDFVQHDGIPQPSRLVRAPGGCPDPDCGQEATEAQDPPRGWVRVGVSGSVEPARLFCSGACAAVGVALAELRMCEA
jgi:hypothetical protein